MKANWKWALMCVAALALVACDKDKKGEPQDPQDPEEETFVSKVNVQDNSIAEWDNLLQTLYLRLFALMTRQC